ncbi:MAG: 23S rRNA (uracil(1939)-C(5))-methyltransferase RlmD [Saprospiraceae bacterium]|nr:23S rRNA (uracil(1939)-C(5))-methyltransferase RlmD [Saprospiraceae bacterium]MDP4821779.1 23S rRNA (uracil(1939)-C(5))-methyltransferase RlmD [Saprospiraceae bacterium]MDP4997935.1 23S rRNA (uracil(1939)-C(5))-methyltransferase RlmD [Saprospiraceae bacterium]
MRKKKPKLIENVQLTGIADKGRVVGRDAEGQVVFVEGGVPGDVADIWVTSKRKGFQEGYVQTIQVYSPDRVAPACAHFGVCGGCKWQHLDYGAQIREKERVVYDALERIGKIDLGEKYPIQGAADIFYYRNKLEFTFCNKKWLTAEEIGAGETNQVNVVGFHKAGAFDKIVPISDCLLQAAPSNDIRNFVRDFADEHGYTFYDPKAQQGWLRNMVVRVTTLGQVMVILSINSGNDKAIPVLLDALREKFPAITSLYFCINPKKNDFLLDLEMQLYAGLPYIEEQLDHIRYRIGPKSFFQTNTRQAESLYRIVRDFAGLTGTENVYDLYTGLGSIALYLAGHSRQVVGVEEISAAIADARENALLNGIENVQFYAGDVKDIVSPEFMEQHGRPDVLVTDPPRAGMHPKVIDILLELESPVIVYVSCNPSTQARDLQLLAEKYDVAKVQPVDMFPHTHHIENVALLRLKNR